MSRILTTGFEIGQGDPNLEGQAHTSGTGASVSQDAVTFRSGRTSLKCVTSSISSNTSAYSQLTPFFATGVKYFARAYFNFSTVTPSQNIAILQAGVVGTIFGSVLLTSAGKLRLVNTSGTQIGSDSPVLSTGTWYRVEFGFGINTGANDDYLAFQLEGTQYGSSTTQNLGTTAPAFIKVGWVDSLSVAAANTLNVDDFAINNDSGVLTIAFPGAGKTVLSLPISDNSRSGWIGGAGGTTNLWDAVNNTPPVGSSTETDLTQIQDSSAGSTDNYIANMQSYSTVGIVAADTVKIVQAVCAYGSNTSGSSDTGEMLITSNPVQPTNTADLLFYMQGVAIGAWPTNWFARWGVAQESPTVTLGISPALKVDRMFAAGGEVDVCFMGLYIDYIPGAVSGGGAHRLSLLGVGL